MAEYSTWILGVGCVLIFYIYDRRKRSYYGRRGIKTPAHIPIIGTYEFLTKGFPVCQEKFLKDLGKVYGLSLFGERFLSIGDVEIMKEITVRQFDHFANRRPQPTKDVPLHKAVSVLEGERWKEVRKILTPAFSANKMKKVASIINEACDQLVCHFEQQKTEPFTQCKELFGSYAMDVVASAFFGLQVDSQKNPNDPFVAHAKESFSATMSSPKIVFLTLFPSLGKIFDFFDIGLFPRHIRKFFMAIMEKAVKIREKSSDKRMDILQLMIDAHKLPNKEESTETPNGSLESSGIAENKGSLDSQSKGLTNVSSSKMRSLEMDELMANSVLFFIAGYETTNTALCFSAYLLATHPEIQEKLIKEVDEKAPTRDEVTYDIMSSMDYLECFIMESLRYYPPVVATDRKCTKEMTYKGITIYKGEVVLLPIYSVHHDPDYWPDPEKFDPERFSKENRSRNHPLAWLPFGYGPRNCIGMRLALMEIKFGLVRLLQEFRFETCSDTVIPLVLNGQSGFTLPRDGVKLRVASRENKQQ